MSTIWTAFFIIIMTFLASCQVKETSGNGLISGHLPSTNSFTVQAPIAKTYLESEVITFKVSFPFDIDLNTTGGTPRLRITVGSTSRFATFTSATPRVLSFEYTIANGDNDTNGIDVNALELNGSTMQFDENGTPTNCNVASVTTKNFPNVRVDASPATISNFQLTNLPGRYYAGAKLNFAVTFSEAVTVTGAPFITIQLGTNARNVPFTSGSGTNQLIFSYEIAQTDLDTNQYDAVGNSIQLNSGTIKDAAGLNAAIDLSAFSPTVRTNSAAVNVVGTWPRVVAVTPPANGSYGATENLDIVLEFDRAVTITGSPNIVITLGNPPSIPNVTKQASWVSGPAGKFHTFRYVTVPGDMDDNGITIATAITQNGATIAAGTSFFQTGNNVLTIPDTTGILVNSIQPSAISVTRNLDTVIAPCNQAVDNKWIIGQDLILTVGFNTNMFVGISNGVPYIPVTIGSTVREARYVSGGDGQTSLVFRYTIQEGDLDTDNTLDIGSIVLNNATITDSKLTTALTTLPITSLTGTAVDGVTPVINNITPPATAASPNFYSAVTGNNQANMPFIVNYSEPVRYTNTGANGIYFNMVIETPSPLTNHRLSYDSGNLSASVTHRSTTALTGFNDTNGVALSTALTTGTYFVCDIAGNPLLDKNIPTTDTSGVRIDSTAPRVTSVSQVTADGYYSEGDTIRFDVTFDESVTILKSSTFPRMFVRVGTNNRPIVAESNGTGTTHTFSYQIQNGEVEATGVQIQTTFENDTTNAYARDIAQNNAVTALSAPISTGIKVDSTVPTISSTTFKVNGTEVTSPYGTWEVGDVLSVTVKYSEAMTVTGTPKLPVTINGISKNFNYSSGSNSTDIVFTYTLVDQDTNFNGLSGSSISSIDTATGTIKDAGDNETASQNLSSSISLSSMKVLPPAVKLWARKEFVDLSRSGSPGISNSGAETFMGCGSGSAECREFDGDDALLLNSNLNDVNTVFLVMKTPASMGPNTQIFGSHVVLKGTGMFWDLQTTTVAAVNASGITSSGTNHNLNLSSDSTYVIQITFTSNQTVNAGVLIQAAFDGQIGEVIAVTGSPDGADLTKIRNYLTGKY